MADTNSGNLNDFDSDYGLPNVQMLPIVKIIKESNENKAKIFPISTLIHFLELWKNKWVSVIASSKEGFV